MREIAGSCANHSIWVGIALLLLCCTDRQTPNIAPGVDTCRECAMVIHQINQACGFVYENLFIPFDSPRCLLHSYQTLRKRGKSPPKEIFFTDYLSGSFIRADSAFFLLTDHIPTVMSARAICFGTREGAQEFQNHVDEAVTTWNGYRTQLSDPDTVVNLRFDANGMDPEVIVVTKGDIVLLRVEGRGLEQDLAFSVDGYQEIGTIIVPSSGETTEFRLLAHRLGLSFPLVRANDGTTLGTIRVLNS